MLVFNFLLVLFSSAQVNQLFFIYFLLVFIYVMIKKHVIKG